MKHTFTVWIGGFYYYDDEEYDVEIDLTDKEMATIKKLVSEYDDLTRGLMPILEAGNKKIYKKFYKTIYPEVFMTLFYRDEMFEPVKRDKGKDVKDFDIEDFDYLIKTYGDYYDFDEAYVCRIPDEMRPPRIHFSKDMSKDDILTYIRRWNGTRNFMRNEMRPTSWNKPDIDEDQVMKLIEEWLIAVAEEAIAQNDPDTLADDDFDPFPISGPNYSWEAQRICEEYEKARDSKP